MSVINQTSQIARNADVAYTYMDDEMVVMGSEDSLYYGINSVGTEIWSFLEEQPQSFQSICNHLQKTYDVDESQCVEDATRFIHSLLEHKMVVVSE